MDPMCLRLWKQSQVDGKSSRCQTMHSWEDHTKMTFLKRILYKRVFHKRVLNKKMTQSELKRSLCQTYHTSEMKNLLPQLLGVLPEDCHQERNLQRHFPICRATVLPIRSLFRGYNLIRAGVLRPDMLSQPWGSSEGSSIFRNFQCWPKLRQDFIEAQLLLLPKLSSLTFHKNSPWQALCMLISVWNWLRITLHLWQSGSDMENDPERSQCW